MARLESPRDRVHPPSLEASPDEHLRHSTRRFLHQPGVPVSLGRVFAAWPASRASLRGPRSGTAHGISPFAAFAPAGQFRARSPRRMPTCRWRRTPSTPINFRRGTGRQTEPDSLSDSRRCAADEDVLAARLLGVDPSVPAVCRRSIRRKLCCPGLCLFRVFRTVHGCSVAGSSPPHSSAVACSASGGSPLLSFGLSRWPSCRGPVGPRRSRATTRRLLFSDSWRPMPGSSGRGVSRFAPRRTSNPYEVFHLLIKRSTHSLA